MPRKYMPRQSISEWRDLGEAAAILDVLGQTIQATKWAPGPLALEGVKRVYETVAGLYNKAEPAALRFKKRDGIARRNGAPEERSVGGAPAGDPGSNQGGAPELEPAGASRGP
jgi:hypothetical protein